MPDSHPLLAGTIVHNCTEVQAIETQPWEVIIRPRTGGRYEHRMAYMRTPSIIAYRERFRIRTHIQGSAPPDMMALSLPILLGDRSRYWRRPPDEHSLPAMIGGGADVVFDSGQVHIIVLVSLGLLRETLSESMFACLQNSVARLGLTAGKQNIEALTRWLNGLIDACSVNPGLLGDEQFKSAVETGFVQHLMALLPDSQNSATSRNPGKRHRALVRALEYMREGQIAHIAIPDLVREAGVCQRTLEYAFRDAFGMAPLKYLRLQKYHAARRMLMETNTRDNRIGEMIRGLGFYHAGRFSREYREMFGESPSETIRNRYPGMRWAQSLFVN